MRCLAWIVHIEHGLSMQTLWQLTANNRFLVQMYMEESICLTTFRSWMGKQLIAVQFFKWYTYTGHFLRSLSERECIVIQGWFDLRLTKSHCEMTVSREKETICSDSAKTQKHNIFVETQFCLTNKRHTHTFRRANKQTNRVHKLLSLFNRVFCLTLKCLRHNFCC